MNALGQVFGGIFDALLVVFGALPRAGSLFAISLLLGLLMLVAFELLGDPKRLATAKNRMQAHLMEMRLFEAEPKVVFAAFGRLMLWNGKFFLATLKPALIATVPMILLFVQMEHYYGLRPLRPGESAVVTVELEHFDRDADLVALQGSALVDVETPVVRLPDLGAVAWRIRGQAEGNSELRLRVGEDLVTKTVTVSETPAKVSLRRVRDAADHLWRPIEPRIEKPSIRAIEVAYPAIVIPALGLPLHWLWWLVFVSVLGALLVRAGVNAIRPGTL